MSALFAEGFTGVARGTVNTMAAVVPLKSLNWQANAIYNGNTAVTASDTNHQMTIEADPIFATRNRLSVKAGLVSAVTSYIQQYKMPLDTTGFEKFVIGFVFNMDSTTSTTGNFQFVFAGPTMWTSSTATPPANELFAGLIFPDNGADGTAYAFSGSPGATTPLIKKGKDTHFEALIEQDVDRVRIYLDGTLVLDSTYTGTFASATGGFSFLIRTTTTIVSTITLKMSNLYVLGLDTIHTGVLGPSTRVLEQAPQTDKAVEWKRPDGFASNAAVLQQAFNSGVANYLTTGVVATDLYNGLDAVGQNAATVHGAVFKVQAMTMAEGSHALASAVSYNGTQLIGTKEYPLTLATLQIFNMDVSKNPVTNAKWTPQEIANAGFGYNLVR